MISFVQLTKCHRMVKEEQKKRRRVPERRRVFWEDTKDVIEGTGEGQKTCLCDVVVLLCRAEWSPKLSLGDIHSPLRRSCCAL
jgi:hypothetical protein